MSELLRSFVSLAPQLDPSEFERSVLSAGQRAGAQLGTQVEQGLAGGAAAGAAKVTSTLRDTGGQAGQQFNKAATSQLSGSGGVAAQVARSFATTAGDARQAGSVAGQQFSRATTSELTGSRGVSGQIARAFTDAEDDARRGGAQAGQQFSRSAGSELSGSGGVAAAIGRMFSGAPQDASREGTQAGSRFVAGVRSRLGSVGDGAVSRIFGGMAQESSREGESVGSRFTTGLKSKIAGAAAGLTAGAVFAQSFGTALDQQSVTAKVTAQLGLTKAQSATAGKVAGALYAAGYGDNMDEVGEAVKSVIGNVDGMRGASTKSLSEISGKVLTVSQTFDQDLGGTTRAVSQLMRTGLAPDAKTALDIITRGFQSGADKSDDFLDTLNEYGTQFRKLGIDGASATGLLSQGLKAGARDGDLVADSLKEFSIRAVDGSKTTSQGFASLGLDAQKMAAQIAKGGPAAKEGLGTVLDRLRAIKDPAKQAQAATALFGTQAEDMGKALFALHPETAAKGLGQVAGATDKANKALNNTPAAKLETFKRGLQQGLVNVLANNLIPGLNSAADRLADFGVTGDRVKGTLSAVAGFLSRWSGILIPVAAGIGALVAGLAIWNTVAAIGTGIHTGFAVAMGVETATIETNTIATRAGQVAALVARGATAAWTGAQWLLNAAMSANPIGLVVLAIVALVAGFVLAYKKSETFRNIVNAAFGAVKSVVSGVVGWFGSNVVPFFTKTLPNAFGSVVNWVRSHWKILASILGGPLVAAVIVISSNWGKIRGFFTGAASWVKGAFKASWNAVGGVLTNPVGSAKNAVSKLLGATGLRAPFSAVGSWAKGAFKASWSAVSGVLTNPVGSAKNAVSKLLGVTGLRAPFSAVASWTRGAFKATWNAVKDVLLAPVKAAVLAVGVLFGDKNARAKFTALSVWVNNVFRSAWNKVKSILTSPITDAKNSIATLLGATGLQSVFSGAVEAIGRIWSKVKGKVTTPINSLLGVFNSFAKQFNKIGSMVGFTIPSNLKLATGGTVPVATGGGHVAGTHGSYAAGGSVIGGPWAGPTADNVLGVDYLGAPRWRVNPGEFITRVRSTQSMQRNFPGYLEHINTFGTPPGYAAGGVLGALAGDGMPAFASGGFPVSGVSWPWQWARVHNKFPDARMTSNVRPGARTAGDGSMSYHAIGRAIDIGGPGSLLRRVATWLKDSYGAASHDLIYSPLWGHNSIYEGHAAHVNDTTYRDHFNHVHWGLRLGGGHGDGKSLLGKAIDFGKDMLGGVTSAMLNPARSLANKALSALGGKFPTPFGAKFLVGAGKKLVSSAIDKALSFGGGDSGSGGASGAAAPANVSGAKAIGKTMAAARGWTGGNWNALYNLWMGESGWRANADNPSSSAYGIPQALPGSKMASAGGDWRTNAATQIRWGLGYIASVYGSPSRAYAKWLARSPHWYAGGGEVANNNAEADKIWRGLRQGNPDAGHAHAAGGPVGSYAGFDPSLGLTLHRNTFDTGGVLQPNWNLVNNQTGGLERLVPEDSRGARGGEQNTFNLHEVESSTQTASDVLYAMRNAAVGVYAERR